jgi:predicted amidohydrolase YtcJ
VTRTLLRGGRLLPATRSTALLVDGDTIAWIGGDDELPDRDRTVDLDGRVLTPAFVDAHVHLALTGFNAMGVDLTESRSATEALDLLAVHARSTGLGVVLGHSWDETRWAGGTTFSREALDRAVAGRPAYVSRVDLHSAFASTALLDAARTHHGHETETLDGWSDQGAVNRDAHHAVRDAMRTLLSADDRAAAIRHALQVAAARGIGVVHELGAPHISHPDDLALAERVRADAAREGGTLPAATGARSVPSTPSPGWGARGRPGTSAWTGRSGRGPRR